MKALLVLLLLALPASAQRTVVIVADDIGVDRIGAYGEHPRAGHTPNIDALARRGLLFRNAWSQPLCTSARACLLTGRYGFRTGIGRNVFADGEHPLQPQHAGLSTDEVTIADMLGPSFVRTAIGKWHLGDKHQAPLHPNRLGFDYYAGSLFNLAEEGYFGWTKTINGRRHVEPTYATTDSADEAVAALWTEEPSFVWLAFNAPHKPYHEPPSELHTYTLFGRPEETIILHAKAMIEAMDTEIGRVLDTAGPDALVFFLGDNGTAEAVTDAPFLPEHAKGTLYEGGLNVPLIVAGPGVATGECGALVNTTDVFATIAELAGRTSAAEDSVSFVPYFDNPDQASIRRWVYAEQFQPNGPGPYNSWRQAIRGERFKLVRRKDQPDELYDLVEDPFEQADLLTSGLLDETQRRAYLRLVASLPFVFESGGPLR